MTLLRLQNLSLTLRNRPVLRDVSLTLGAGEVVGCGVTVGENVGTGVGWGVGQEAWRNRT